MPRSFSLTPIAIEQYSSQLLAAAIALNVELSHTQIEKLLGYLELLLKWNHTYNLTAIRDPSQMLGRHLVDSLSIAPYIEGNNILDVGTGAGLPGIPLAIAFPEIEFQLLDSNVKKTRFLTQCKIELVLDNVGVSHSRIEESHFEFKFDQIVSRALASLGSIVALSAHLLRDDGKFLAMKGISPKHEDQAVQDPFQVEKQIKLQVPGCEGQRHLIIIGKKS